MKLQNKNTSTIKSTNNILKTLVFSLVFVFTSTSTQAQFFKKLQKKAEKKIEREAERRAERRVNKKIDKTFDKAEEGIDKTGEEIKGKKKKETKKETADLPASYNFEWEYTVKMESEEMTKKAKGMDMKMIYYLNPNSSVFASKIDMKNNHEAQISMIGIIDIENGVNVSLMDMNGQKIIQKMPSFSGDDTDEEALEQASKNYTVVKTDTKTILGYHCQGFKITSDDGIIKTYIAKNAPVSFINGASQVNTKYTPKGFNPKWLKEFENGLMMEMEFISSKKKKHNMKMTCVSLEKKPLTINISEYKSFGK